MASQLNARRIIVWIASLVAGFAATLLIFAVIGTDFNEFGIEAVLVIISLSVTVMIWLDYFLGAEILPD